MSGMFVLIDPTTMHSDDDIRVTTYDLYKIVAELGGTQNHHDIKAIADRVFGDEVTPYQQLVNCRTGQTVDAGVMDKDMALAVASKLGGVAGDKITRYLREKLREMRTTIHTQAAHIARHEGHTAAMQLVHDDYLPRLKACTKAALDAHYKRGADPVEFLGKLDGFVNGMTRELELLHGAEVKFALSAEEQDEILKIKKATRAAQLKFNRANGYPDDAKPDLSKRVQDWYSAYKPQ